MTIKNINTWATEAAAARRVWVRLAIEAGMPAARAEAAAEAAEAIWGAEEAARDVRSRYLQGQTGLRTSHKNLVSLSVKLIRLAAQIENITAQVKDLSNEAAKYDAIIETIRGIK